MIYRLNSKPIFPEYSLEEASPVSYLLNQFMGSEIVGFRTHNEGIEFKLVSQADKDQSVFISMQLTETKDRKPKVVSVELILDLKTKVTHDRPAEEEEESDSEGEI